MIYWFEHNKYFLKIYKIFPPICCVRTASPEKQQQKNINLHLVRNKNSPGFKCTKLERLDWPMSGIWVHWNNLKHEEKETRNLCNWSANLQKFWWPSPSSSKFPVLHASPPPLQVRRYTWRGTSVTSARRSSPPKPWASTSIGNTRTPTSCTRGKTCCWRQSECDGAFD